MQRRNVTPHVESIDLAGATSIPLPAPHVMQAPYLSQYVMVIDSITASILADGPEDCGFLIAAEDGQSLFKYSRTFAAAERDCVHMTFPRGLVLHKFMAAEGTGQTSSQPGMAAYQGAGWGATLTIIGVPLVCQVLLSYRFVHPSDVGTA